MHIQQNSHNSNRMGPPNVIRTKVNPDYAKIFFTDRVQCMLLFGGQFQRVSDSRTVS